MAEENRKIKDAKLLQVLEKMRRAKSVLVALSNNPSLDEMAAALGLTLMLDKMGKHATAIYSGATPNALEFLKPGETFEKNTHSLQEFIIALDKNKADHLRYKVDGNYVKIYITPYKTNITKDDLEFSRGQYNVDLVIAMNVLAPKDLDGALAEHGRILHNATTINMTVGRPGRFGEIEWSNQRASSVSEMTFGLVSELAAEKGEIGKDVATALLTGIVAATNRFSNEKTMPQTMTVAARLMMAGADQQLVSANIPVTLMSAAGVGVKKRVNANLDEGAGVVSSDGEAGAGAGGGVGVAGSDGITVDVSGGNGVAVDNNSSVVSGGDVLAVDNSSNNVVSVDIANAGNGGVTQSIADLGGAMGEAGGQLEIINNGEGMETPEEMLPLEEPEGGKDFGAMMQAELAEALPVEVAEQQATEEALRQHEASLAAAAAQEEAAMAAEMAAELAEVEGELAESEIEAVAASTPVENVAPGVPMENVAPGVPVQVGVSMDGQMGGVPMGNVVPGMPAGNMANGVNPGMMPEMNPAMGGMNPVANPAMMSGANPAMMATPEMPVMTPGVPVMDSVNGGAMMNGASGGGVNLPPPPPPAMMPGVPMGGGVGMPAPGMPEMMPAPGAGMSMPVPAMPAVPGAVGVPEMVGVSGVPGMQGGAPMMAAPEPPKIILNKEPMVKPIEPATPDVAEMPYASKGTGLSMVDQVYPQQDPGAFKIPGM